MNDCLPMSGKTYVWELEDCLPKERQDLGPEDRPLTDGR